MILTYDLDTVEPYNRCGSEIALTVENFLETAIPDRDTVFILGLTEKQVEAIGTWTSNAKKEAEKMKPPSKSVLKKQAQATRNKKERQELLKKKKERRLRKQMECSD